VLHDVLFVAGNNQTYVSLQEECQIFLSDFNQISSLSIGLFFKKKYPTSHLTGIPPVGATPMYAYRRGGGGGRWMDMAQMTGAFRDYPTRLKKAVQSPTRDEYLFTAYISGPTKFYL
jgi:hypothetical protein